MVVPVAATNSIRRVAKLRRPRRAIRIGRVSAVAFHATLIRPKVVRREPKASLRPMRSIRIGTALADIALRRMTGRGKYRIFNTAGYRLYRSFGSPPLETDMPFATAASLPVTPDVSWEDGVWYISCSYFNGIHDSGFLPMEADGRTWRRLEIAGGVLVVEPPRGPDDWRIELSAGGVVRIVGCYSEAGTLRATQWAIGYTTNGSYPAKDQPMITAAMTRQGPAILSLNLPAQVNGTVVRVRLQTRRANGTGWRYSEGSEVKSLEVTL